MNLKTNGLEKVLFPNHLLLYLIMKLMFKNGQPYLGTFNLTLSPSHPLTLSPSHPLTLSPSHPLTLSPSHPLTLSPSHHLTLSPSHHLSPPHPLTTSPPHHLTLSPSHPLTLFKIKFLNREERKSTSFFVSLRIIKKKKHHELYRKNVATNGIKR